MATEPEPGTTSDAGSSVQVRVAVVFGAVLTLVGVGFGLGRR